MIKLWFIPRNLEGHTQVQFWTYDQENPEKALLFHLWLILSLYENRKWRLRQNCKLPAGALKIWAIYIQSLSVNVWKFIDSRYLKKSLSNFLLTTKVPEQTIKWLHMTKIRLNRISPGKSWNKEQKQWQEQTTITNIWGREGGTNLISRIATLYYLKCTVFTNKLQEVHPGRKVWPIHRGKKAINKNCSCRSPDVEFTEQRFWIIYYKYG